MHNLTKEKLMERSSQKRHKKAAWIAFLLFVLVLTLLIIVLVKGGGQALDEWAVKPVEQNSALEPATIAAESAETTITPEQEKERQTVLKAHGEELYQENDGTWRNRPVVAAGSPWPGSGNNTMGSLGSMLSNISQNQYIRDNLGGYTVLLDLLAPPAAQKNETTENKAAPEEIDDRVYIGDIYLDKDGVWRNRPSKPSRALSTATPSPLDIIMPPSSKTQEAGSCPYTNEMSSSFNSGFESIFNGLQQNLGLDLNISQDIGLPGIKPQDLPQPNGGKQIKINEYEFFDRSQYNEKGEKISKTNE